MTSEARPRSDAEVVRASLTDPQAFGALFHRHFDVVYGYLVRRGGVGVADDLTGEVFRAAFEQRRRFDLRRASARPWLYGIAANMLRRHLRDHNRRGAAYRRLLNRKPVAVIDDLEAADAAIDARRQATPLAEALANLAPGDREALLLQVWEDLSYTEIAEALGIPVGTVRSRLHRSRRKLRIALAAREADQPARRPDTNRAIRVGYRAVAGRLGYRPR